MTDSDDHFSDEFGPHSKHKHLIFKKYCESWVHKMGLRRGGGGRLRVVDACAGRGHDGVGNPGSPLIAARAAVEAAASISRFQREVRIDVIAIEKNRDHFQELSRYLSTFPGNVRALHGSLEQHFPALEEEFGDTPTLFFIDPFGLSPLKADVVRQALAGAKNEVFLLFADQAALRHFGVVQATETRAMRELRRHKERGPSLFPDMDEEERLPLAKKAAKSEAALEVTRTAAKATLDAAFGGSAWLEALEKAQPSDRRAVFLSLYRKFLRDCGATHVLEIPILNEDGVHLYSLLYATKSAKGYTTMKDAVASALNGSPLPTHVVEQMRDILSVNVGPIADKVRKHFAGKTVRWTKDAENADALSLREALLENTPLYPFQLRELQELLRKYRLPGRQIQYAFPVEAD